MQIRDPKVGINVRLDDPAIWADPYPVYARMRQAAPLVRGRMPPLGSAWLATRHEDVSTILKDPKLFRSDARHTTGKSGPLDGRFTPKILRNFARSMVFLDGLDHRRLRGLVTKAFTPAQVTQLSARIEAITVELLDQAQRQGTFDLMSSFALPLPLRIISDLLGVEKEEEDYFHRTATCILELNSAWNFIKRLPRLIGLQRFFERLLERKRANPGDDLTSALIAAEEEGDRLSSDELMGMVFLLLFAGHETTVNLLGNGTLTLLDNPEQLERLRADPALIPTAIEEMLRYQSPAQLTGIRYVSGPVELGGMSLERGDRVVPMVAAANRDERVFDDPDTFDVGRQPNRHLAFGAGQHFCVGAHLSRVEARIAFSVFIERFPHLRLATARDQVRWNKSTSLRGLQALPVTLARAA